MRITIFESRHPPAVPNFYGRSEILPCGSGFGNGSVSGVTRTAVVNLNGYFPPLGYVNSTK
jgi:hypothetical protein